MSEKISNEKLAALCGISLSHFMKLYVQVYHRTPQEYLMRQRIETARHLLTHSEKSVESIAFQLCFCTTSHFIKRFKKEVGDTPAQYRKKAFGHEKHLRTETQQPT